MDSVEVDPVGLLSLAIHCESHAARLASLSTPSTSGSSSQPSTAAVVAAHMEVAAISARLAARMQETGTSAAAAAGDFATTEASSVGDIAEVGDSGITAV